MHLFRQQFILSIICCAVITLCGCDLAALRGKATPGITLDEANKKFIRLCEQTLEMTPVLRKEQNTLWIYFPMEGPILDIIPSPLGPSKSNQPTRKAAIKYLDVVYDQRAFVIEFDIAGEKSYPIDYGYTSGFSKIYQRIQSKVIEATQQTYFEIEKVPGDVEYKHPLKKQTHRRLVKSYVKTDKAPEFLALVIADINKGIEVVSFLYLNDLKRVMSKLQSITPEEYRRRYVTELRGGTQIVDDKTGSHIKYRPLPLSEFIARQIKNRIDYQYKKSSFPPHNVAKLEILNQTYQTMQAYAFKEYDKIYVYDLATSLEMEVTPEELSKYAIEAPERKGQYFILEFNPEGIVK
ncbi:MAG: hypothetical protein K8S27_11750 [Candidatus Omnitrophica bacterium]|nr:hypothetical protein [Candidatus Omnitrophota bacterium]